LVSVKNSRNKSSMEQAFDRTGARPRHAIHQSEQLLCKPFNIV
jgi:hypothetical protein